MSESLEERIRHSERAQFGHGIPDSLITEAEEVLNVTFPTSYRWWLSRYGAGYLAGYELQGLSPVPPTERTPDEVIVGDVVATTLRNRRDGLPEHLLEMLNYEGDEVFYLDLSRMSSGEAPVVCKLPNEPQMQTVASSFAEFLGNHL